MWSDSEAGHGNDGAFGRSSVTGSRGGLGGSFAASGGRAFQGERSLRRSLGSLHSRTGGVDPRPRGGKSRSLLEPHLAWLLDLTIAEPDLTLEAIVQSLLAGLGLKTSEAAVRRFFKRHAITFKKALHAAEQDRPDVSLARERWKASQASVTPPSWCSSTRRTPTPRWSASTGDVEGASDSSARPLGSLEDHNLHLRPALRRSGRNVGAGRSHDRRRVPHLRRVGARPNPLARRHCRHRQSLQPQGCRCA